LVTDPPVADGLAAVRRGDLAAGRRLLESAVATVPSGEALEALGEALYLECEYVAAAEHYERAYTAYRKAKDVAGAGRVARTLSWITGAVLGEWAVRSGWLARARTLLGEAGKDRPEHGWVLILGSFVEPDPAIRESLLREAVEIGRRHGDPDVEFMALAHLGGVLVVTDRVEEGLVHCDEALAALCADEVTDVAVIDSIFCGLFSACERVNDVPRAEQWMRMAESRIKRSNVVAASCRAHYGGILTAAGRWTEAETALVEAARLLERGMSGRREEALIRLADLRVRQGRIDEAAELLAGLEGHADAARPLAAVYLSQGKTAVARDLLERRTGGPDELLTEVAEKTTVGPLLAILVDVHLAAGDVAAADTVARRLDQLARPQPGRYLLAVAALAKGRVGLAKGSGEARMFLHVAVDGFGGAQLPMEQAVARLDLAKALAERSPEGAVAEATAALTDLDRLEATRYADEAGELLRSLGVTVRTGRRGADALTKRETEVLRLLGEGLSNPEIGDRLYITRKTVEHHVGRVLSKLGLRNRAQAAAYATRQEMSR
jgi:DNA-binding CsgD family transcriptional regulator